MVDGGLSPRKGGFFSPLYIASIVSLMGGP